MHTRTTNEGHNEDGDYEVEIDIYPYTMKYQNQIQELLNLLKVDQFKDKIVGKVSI